MDLWRVSKDALRAAAAFEGERLGLGAPASVYRPSGLYVWVTYANGEQLTLGAARVLELVRAGVVTL